MQKFPDILKDGGKYSKIPVTKFAKGSDKMSDFSVGLFNDSFPPLIDGVAQTVKNYAHHLCHRDCRVTVVTPDYRDAVDNYDFDVYRYPSLPAGSLIGYRVGVPFGPETLVRLHNKKFDIMHIHAPFASSVLAANLNRTHRVPTVLTYHTKFDLDIEKRVPTAPVRKIAMEFLLHNVNAADEIWVVSNGSVESLRRIGYEGTCRIMENGTDFARGTASAERISALREQYHLHDDTPVLLYVGRLMWYKNIRLILDALKTLHDGGMKFRAFIIGDGYDAPEMVEYARMCQLQDCVTFTGPIHDREHLRTFYSIADLFLFPSTYDTNGIVVKEAAACDCPSLLVRNSCAAEGTTHNQNAFWADENAQSCADGIAAACSDRQFLKQVGTRAGKELYLSWEEAVDRAYTRYREILELT